MVFIKHILIPSLVATFGVAISLGVGIFILTTLLAKGDSAIIAVLLGLFLSVMTGILYTLVLIVLSTGGSHE